LLSPLFQIFNSRFGIEIENQSTKQSPTVYLYLPGFTEYSTHSTQVNNINE
jgi:hypothetical protein